MKLLELLKVDFEKGVTLAVYEITVKRDSTINDVNLPEEIEVFNILEVERSKYICFVKTRYKDEFLKNKLKEFDLDLIWTTLMIEPRNKVIISVIGDNENLN